MASCRGLILILVAVLIFAHEVVAQVALPADQGAAQASSAEDWKNRVTYKQFETLLMHKVSQVSPLSDVWSMPNIAGVPSAQAAMWGAGRFRGLLRWLDEQLRIHSYETVMHLRPPSVYRLNPTVIETDLDLFVANNDVAEELRGIGFERWDLLTQADRKESILLGGSPIEKVAISPHQISDPFGALKDFYEGRLRFVVGDLTLSSQFLNGKEIKFTNRNHLQLILRAIRHSYDIPRMKIDESTWVLFRKLLSPQNNQRNQSPIEKMDAHTKRQLEKLASVISNDQAFAKVLAKLDILDRLAELKTVIHYFDTKKRVVLGIPFKNLQKSYTESANRCENIFRRY